MIFRKKRQMVSADGALAGRTDQKMLVPERHFVNGNPLVGPWPDGYETVVFGLGCFWGAERKFWETEGVYSTSVGYAGGFTPNPTYEETCSGMTGHSEVVQVVFDPSRVSFDQLLRLFWESHNPTQGMRQGNDVGSQYRSAIYYTTEAQHASIESSLAMYQERLTAAKYGEITTEIQPLGEFFYAEQYHQQYLAKNPNGYCGIGGTGVSCPIGITALQGLLRTAPAVRRVDHRASEQGKSASIRSSD
jgi:peptide-methionine (S)-S-oxide reductase